MIRLRGARSVAICMQKDKGGGGKDQPQKADKKPRKRSSAKARAQDPFAMPEPQMKPGGGPLGKAKRRMLERIGEVEEQQEAQWTNLKGKLQQERVDDVWAADDPALAEKRKRWNQDLTAPSSDMDDDERDKEFEMEVTSTNDADWKQVRDVSTGDIYFWNVVTEQTTWDIPEGIQVANKLSPFRGVTKTLPDPGGAPGERNTPKIAQ